MCLQARGNPRIWFLAIRPSKSLAPFPINSIATKLLQKSEMRVYGSALVLEYSFCADGPRHTYTPLPQGAFLAIRGVKEALEEAGANRALEEKHRALEESFRAPPLSAVAEEAAQASKNKWTISSFGSCPPPSTTSHVPPASSPPQFSASPDAEAARPGSASASIWSIREELSALQERAQAESQAREKAQQDLRLHRAGADVAVARAEAAVSKAKLEQATLLSRLQRAEAEAEAAVARAAHEVPACFPPYWLLEHEDGIPFRKHSTRFMKPIVENVLKASSRHHSGQGDCSRMAQARVVSVERVENPSLWRRFQQCKQHILDEHARHKTRISRLEPPLPPALADLDPSGTLDPLVNEKFLFHGTTTENAEMIARQGFDERVAGKGLYGSGIYFAHEACKSSQYGGRGIGAITVFVIGRVVLGDPHYTKTAMASQKRPPERDPTTHRLYDSVVASGGIANSGSQVHSEYVVYDRLQAYPEFIARVVL
mmetsp:Transcript_82430/g.229709  ORF Transcript_82430/g.229709 Transcript_82430/m.229709 type:complete len:486 (+) Transcript_82430:663-2120(+)